MNVQNKKFWEDLIVYLPFAVICISDTINRKKTVVCVCVMKMVKQYSLEGCSVGITDSRNLWYTAMNWVQMT
jgi:hypothetical protein